MKQTRLTRFLNYILVMLGFSAINSCGEIFRAEYGTPTMDFEVSGKVVSEADVPIQGIKVSCQTFSGEEVTYSAENGSFSIGGTSMYVLLNFSDIDGPENGGDFADMSQQIEVEQVQEGEGRWDLGKFEAKDVVITMKQKE